MLAIRADLSLHAAQIEAALSLPVPDTLGLASGNGEALAWFSPDELLLVCSANDVERHQSSIAEALKGTHHLLADVSDMRAGFTLSGPRVREVLSKLVPMDVHPDVLVPGRVRRTQLGQVAAALWLTEESRAEIICFRSVFAYVGTALAKAADPRAAIAG